MSVESRALVLQHAIFLASNEHFQAAVGPVGPEGIVDMAEQFHEFIATPEARGSGLVVPQ